MHCALATIRWDGVVDTITNLPGTQFFYGPICPDEPQYVTAAITTGNLWPTMAFFTGNAGYNGEGTKEAFLARARAALLALHTP